MSMNGNLNRSNPPPQQNPTPGGSSAIWWAILVGLLLWNLFTLWPRSTPELHIAYSTFLEQVKAGNVKEVLITGAQIQGQFVKAIPAPQGAAENAGSKGPGTGSPPQASNGSTAQPRSEPSKPGNAGTGTAQQKPVAAPTTYTHFRTVFPEAVGDPRLMPLLEAHHVTIKVQQPSSPWFMTLLIDWLPMLLLIGYFVWMGRQMSRSQSGLFSFGRSKARQYSVKEHPEVTFKDVAGADEAKGDLEEVVDFLRHPAKYHDIGARIPRGILLVGPPGTGKTLLGRAVAGEAQVPFFHISASEFVEMFVGVGASRVRGLFRQAEAAAPSIVFVDELDAVGRRRGAGLGAVNDEREQTLNQLLVQMDGFDERHEVIVLAATNRPDVLDPALQRPGRFDRQVVVGLPDRQGRRAILDIHSKHLPLGQDVDFDVLARKTAGMSGADLANLCNEAALGAARRSSTQVAMADFEEAVDRVLLGGERPALTDPGERRLVAYHEAGHTVVAWLTPNADPVHKVTIIPRGHALGATEQLPGDDRHSYSRNYLLARIDVMLGGRVAEEVVFGELTTGAESDLIQATRLARRMATRWGMGSLGPLAFETDEQQPFLGYDLARGRDYSEKTAAQIDEDVKKVLADRSQAVADLLKKARDKLDALAETLLREETADERILTSILGPPAEKGEPDAAPQTA
jgi:cell division protease FtsH